MRIQPVVIISPLVWLVITFWKPLLVAFLVFVVLVSLMVPIVEVMVRDDLARAQPAPTMYIPQVWRDALTQGALRSTTPVPTP